jgi:multimeric flavodoxin WrbA
MQIVSRVFDAYTPHILHAYDTNVSSCDDCKVCHYKPSCKFNDDMSLVYTALDDIDTLVIASPIYFGSLSDKIMSIINRFQPYFEKKFTHNISVPKIKNIYLISTCASKSTSMFNGPNISLKILSDLFNATNTHTLTFTNTDNIDDVVAENKDEIDSFTTMIKKELT